MKKLLFALALSAVFLPSAHAKVSVKISQDPGAHYWILKNERNVNGVRYVITQRTDKTGYTTFEAREFFCETKSFRSVTQGIPFSLEELKKSYTDRWIFISWRDSPISRTIGEKACSQTVL